MSFDIPTVAEIQLAAESGQRITQDDVSAISQAESALTGQGPSRGGPAGEDYFNFLQWTGLIFNSNCTESLDETNELWR